jgi:thiopeptide-type bacteriocin biosynthesis protein
VDETAWQQVNIAFPGSDPHKRERQAVAHLSHVVSGAEASGLITSWSFIRKGRWRVRYLPSTTSHQHEDPVHRRLTHGVDWTHDIYEPEVHAFGGLASMDAAHQLFHADSNQLLTYLHSAPTDRRERSLILCTTLMRAAGLDFGEQGDVWARIAEQRAALLPAQPDTATWESFTSQARHLLLGDPRPGSIADDWLTAFEAAGSSLRALREDGHLTRGLRAVTALHVMFHWNRIGIPGTTQAQLSRAAKEAVFDSTR